MIKILPLLLLLVLFFVPRMWAGWALRRHEKEMPGLSLSGGQLARQLLDEAGLHYVGLEAATPGGDHYDPLSRTVRLSPAYLQQRSITALAVAAHEVGHAIQHQQGYRPLLLRHHLVGLSNRLQVLASWVMMALPVISALGHSPRLMFMVVAIGVLSMGSQVVVHLVTLPVEFDASFGRALPMLAKGYIHQNQQGAARHVLMACAFTYVASAMANVLNVVRWFVFKRR